LGLGELGDIDSSDDQLHDLCACWNDLRAGHGSPQAACRFSASGSDSEAPARRRGSMALARGNPRGTASRPAAAARRDGLASHPVG
jgi:hypothetical protein